MPQPRRAGVTVATNVLPRGELPRRVAPPPAGYPEESTAHRQDRQLPVDHLEDLAALVSMRPALLPVKARVTGCPAPAVDLSACDRSTSARC